MADVVAIWETREPAPDSTWVTCPCCPYNPAYSRRVGNHDLCVVCGHGTQYQGNTVPPEVAAAFRLNDLDGVMHLFLAQCAPPAPVSWPLYRILMWLQAFDELQLKQLQEEYPWLPKSVVP